VRKSTWPAQILALGMWAVVAALGLWILVVSHSAFLGVIASRVDQESTSGFWQFTALERFFVVGAGLAWLVVVILTESYFRRGAQSGRMLSRFARVLGALLLLLFVVDAILLSVQGWGAGTWFRLLILVAELALGVVLVLVGRSSPSIRSEILSDD
jgi:hypothetical protein